MNNCYRENIQITTMSILCFLANYLLKTSRMIPLYLSTTPQFSFIKVWLGFFTLGYCPHSNQRNVFKGTSVIIPLSGFQSSRSSEVPPRVNIPLLRKLTNHSYNLVLHGFPPSPGLPSLQPYRELLPVLKCD